MAHEDEPGIEQMWRQQPSARQTMSLETIRAKARDFDMNVRRWRMVSGLTFALLLVKNVWEVWVDTDVVERAGDLLMVFALLSVVYLFRRHVRAHVAPSALGLSNCVEHYRSLLMRQRDISRDGWKYLLPFVPGLGLIIFGRALEGRPASQVTALIVGTLGVFIGVIWVIVRGARKLEREIAALD